MGWNGPPPDWAVNVDQRSDGPNFGGRVHRCPCCGAPRPKMACEYCGDGVKELRNHPLTRPTRRARN